MKVDHIFIRSTVGAPEITSLMACGAVEGEPHVHPGQGTSNRRFFFNNMMLEFIWISNEAEVKSQLTSPMKLYERLNGSSEASPFGVCFKSETSTEKPPFESFQYKPIYLPEQLHIDVEKRNNLSSPLWFYANFMKENTKNLTIQLSVTNITIYSTDRDEVKLFQFENTSNMSFEYGTEHLLVIEVNHHQKKLIKDFRPSSPLIIKW